MVQSVENLNKPIYSAVNIHITKPEVNASAKVDDNTTDNGIYNSVKIDIDNPTANTLPKVYDYPQAEEIVTYDKLNPSVEMPKGLISSMAVYSSSVENDDSVEKEDTELEETDIPEANYTTVEEQKGEDIDLGEKKTFDSVETKSALQFKAANGNSEIKRPEIIPSEEIKPDLDVDLVISNLENEDMDTQARQLEEIVRIGLDNLDNVKPYIVKDVISSILDIIKRDTSNLTPPTNEQFEIREKIIANVNAIEMAQAQNKEVQLPYQLSEEDIAKSEITPLEQAERNKGYAISAVAILSKKYINDVEKDSENVVPFTEIPGISEIVDTLKNSQNTKVKVSALDALRYLARPEYLNEMNMIFTIAEADGDKEVAEVASFARKSLDEIRKS